MEPVPAHLERSFRRELEFVAPSRHKQPADSVPDLVLDPAEEEGPEQIQSLHYDLAAPLLEEFVLCLEPYPRSLGSAFAPQSQDAEQPQSPFAVLKTLK